MLATRGGRNTAANRTALEPQAGAQAAHSKPTIGGDRNAAANSTALKLQEEAKAAPPMAAIGGGGHTAANPADQGKLLERLLGKSGASITPQREITWDTEIEKLYYKEEYHYPRYRAETTWSSEPGRTHRLTTDDESCLVDFKPRPLQPPRLLPKRKRIAPTKTEAHSPRYAHGPAEAQAAEDPPRPPLEGMRWEDNPIKSECHPQ